jgi:phosphotransacetylase
VQHLSEQDELYQEWVNALGSHEPRVVLADGDDPRAAKAAGWLAEHTSVQPVLVTADATSRERTPPGVDLVSTADLAADERVVEALRLKANGEVRPGAEVDALRQDPLYLATAYVAAGRAEACVAGAARTTADVIRAGLKVIGLREGVSSVSSCFLIVLPDGRRLAYGDCAVLPVPDDRQLADIAIATAGTFENLTGEEPAVAMLSFSTLGSADHPEVDRVRAATQIVRSLQPGLCIDGELQFDAAILESVGRSKADGSPVAGRANVLIFPNLAAGNIGYKITERLAGASAIGPVLQGLRAPLNDLSRGCSSMDVAAVSLVSALQAVSN